MTNATGPALRAETDLNTEHSAGGISPSSKIVPEANAGSESKPPSEAGQ